jgi:hypothetical protein
VSKLSGALVVGALLIGAALLGVAALRPTGWTPPAGDPASPYHGPSGSRNADPYGVGPYLPRPPTGPLTGDL